MLKLTNINLRFEKIQTRQFRSFPFPISNMSSCMICLEDKFNKTTKTKTECLFCHEIICRACLKQCLLNDSAVDICCPSCRAVWSQDFLVSNLPATFRTGELKKHREKVLFDREKLRLPMFMEDARRYKTALDASEPIRLRMQELRDMYNSCASVQEYKKAKSEYLAKHSNRSFAILNDKVFRTREAMKRDTLVYRINGELSTLAFQMTDYNDILKTLGAAPAVDPAAGGAGAGAAEPVERHRRIVMACPAASCAGFVDTLWKCGMCDTKICKDCRVIKNDGHECNADDIATARAIAAESKPCPKCAAAISKVSGCDQMWCTVCHTTFSWNTGKIETAVIHNPHYFQWLAATGRTLPRADLPGAACDVDGGIMRGITRLHQEARLIRDPSERRNQLQLLDKIAERHRERLDMEAGDLARIRNRVREYMEGNWSRELCIKRLAKEISETEWQIKLQRAEKAHHKERAWLQLMEMYAVATRDILGRIATETEPNLADIMNQHDQLHKFVHEQSIAISKAYQCIMFQITPDMKEPEKPKKAAVAGAGSEVTA